MRPQKTILLDLRKVGLSREQWRELRLKARDLDIPMGARRHCRLYPTGAAESLSISRLANLIYESWD
jgi:hypothetical protein